MYHQTLADGINSAIKKLVTGKIISSFSLLFSLTSIPTSTTDYKANQNYSDSSNDVHECIYVL